MVKLCDSNCWARSYGIKEPTQPNPKPAAYTALPATDHLKELTKSVYTPLEPWQMRILSLEPGAPGDPLVGSLVVTALLYFEGGIVVGTGKQVSYAALSYSWGYPDFNRVLR